MLRYLRRLAAPAALTVALFAPMAFSPSSDVPTPKSAADCGPNESLAAQASEVRKIDDRHYLYKLEVGDFETAQAGIHRDVPASPQTPWTSTAVNGRKYRYWAEMWVYHTISDPCSGADIYQGWANADCHRLNVSTGAIAHNNPCSFDVRVSIQALTGGTWDVLGGWFHYSAHFHTFCETVGTAPVPIADNVWVRTVTFVDTAFWHYPDYDTSQPANARWASTPSVRMIQLGGGSQGHQVMGNNLYDPGKFIDASEEGPGPIFNSDDCI